MIEKNVLPNPTYLPSLHRVAFGSLWIISIAGFLSCGVEQKASVEQRRSGLEASVDQSGSTTDISNFPAAKGQCISYDLFHSLVEPKLTPTCGACHGPSGVAHQVFSIGSVADDHFDWLLAKAKVDLSAPSQSRIILKSTGALPHAGGSPFSPDGPEAKLLLAWATEEQRCASLPGGSSNSQAPGTHDSATPASQNPSAQTGAQFALASFPENCPTYPSFSKIVAPILANNCSSCHGIGGPGGGAFPVSQAGAACSAIATTWHQTEQRVNVSNIDRSLLLQKATGAIAHSGGSVLIDGSDDYQSILDWIGKEKSCVAAGYSTAGDASLDPCNPTLWRLLVGVQIGPVYVGDVTSVPASVKLSDGSDGSIAGAAWTSSAPVSSRTT